MKIALMMHKYRKMSSTSYSEVPGDSASIDPGHPKPMPPRKTHLEARIERAPVESRGSFFFHFRSNFSSLAIFAANRPSAYPHPESRAVLLSAIGESLVFLDTDRGPNLAASPFPDTPRAAGSQEPTS